MSKFFRKKPGFGAVVFQDLPGVGNDEIVGEEYKKYFPVFFEEVSVSEGTVVLDKFVLIEKEPELISFPVIVPPSEEITTGYAVTVPSVEVDKFVDALVSFTDNALKEEKSDFEPSLLWKKAKIQAYAIELGIDLGDMTKQELLDAIKEATNEMS